VGEGRRWREDKKSEWGRERGGGGGDKKNEE
jgi:hypothetical protein